MPDRSRGLCGPCSGHIAHGHRHPHGTGGGAQRAAGAREPCGGGRHALRRQRVERARYEAELARRRYMAVDPNNRLVADALEAEWNERLRTVAEAQEEYERRTAAELAPVSEEQRAKILALATDFPALWRDPNTPQRERKRMVRLLVEDVTLLKRDGEIAAHVRFRGGKNTSLALPVPPPAWEARQTPAAIVTEIDRLVDDHTDVEIAAILNERGLRSGEGKPFHRLIVRHLREAYGLRSRYERLRAAGLLSLDEIARRLGVCTHTIKRWHREGRITGHRFNDKGECLYEIPTRSPFKNIGRPPEGGRRAELVPDRL